MLVAITGILEDGSIPDPGILQNPRATIRISRSTDAVLQLTVITPAGAKVPIALTDQLFFTVKRSPTDEAPALQIHGVPVLVTPVNATFTLGSGTLPTGTKSYRVSAGNIFGETLASAETSLGITGPAGVNVNWGAVANAVFYKVYGRVTGAELLMATVAAPTITWLDDGSITPLGALPTGINLWHVTFTPADTMDLEGNYVYDVILVHGGLRDVIVPASPFRIDPSPGYRP